ncbi:MAG: VTT domain-containing protein [Chitinophagaceae bacterium]
MENSLVNLFHQYPEASILISLFLSVIIAVLGVVPSVLITAANILFFGFWPGILLSFVGEAAGAAVAFLLYRKGFKKRAQKGLDRYPRIKRLVAAEGSTAFSLIFTLRLLPLVPSGLVTFAGAVGKVSTGIFVLASSLGKIPALLIEGYSIYEVGKFGMLGKIILTVAACGLLYFIVKQIMLRRKER